MDKLLQKIKHYDTSSHKYFNARVLFVLIGVLTVFNLGANLFNSYMAFTSKADQRVLREAQAQISSNIARLEKQKQSIEKLQIEQDANEVNATGSDERQDKSDVRQTQNGAPANK